MAKNKTSFQKGHKGLKQVGAVSQKTKMWEALGEYVVSQGAERAMTYLQTMDDKEYFNSYMQMLEYFKPKQARVDQSVDITSKGESIIPILGGITVEKNPE